MESLLKCSRDEPGLAPVIATILWVGCMAVGGVGILVPAVAQTTPAKHVSPVVATLIQVQLSSDVSPPPNSTSPPIPQREAGTAPPAAPTPSEAPPLTTVAFAMPTSTPLRIASTAAVVTRQVENNSTTPPAVQRITYGVGEGAQPKPEYPPEAEIARQYGNVLVRFTIAEDGRVTSAEAIKQCPYPLLNQSAVRTIRDEWQFAPGPVRVREIVIEFAPKPQ